MARSRSYIEGALAQGLPSATNFVAALWLVWQGSIGEFGVYSLLFAVSGLITAVQRPLVCLPMSVFAARTHTTDHYADFFHFHVFSLVPGTLLALLVGAFLEAPWLAFGLYAASQLLRDFVKCYLFSIHDRRAAMLVEVLASGIFLVGMVIAHTTSLVTVQSVLLSLALGGLAYLVPWVRIRGRLEGGRRRRFRWRRYLFIWRYSRWSLAGVATNEVATRSYNYIVAWFAGYEVLGLINFIRQCFSPIQLLGSSWSQISLPVMREHYSDKNMNKVHHIRWMGQVGFIVITVVWSIVLYLVFPLLQRLQPELESPNVNLLLLLWCLFYLIDSQIMLFRVELTIQRAFRYLFYTELVCALGIVLFSFPVVTVLSEYWLIGMTCVLNSGLLLVYLLRFKIEKPQLSSG